MARPKSRRSFRYVSSIVAGICLLAFFASVTSTRDIAEHARVLTLFENAKVANHDLDENILRLRTFMLNTYDPIVRDVDRLKQICNLMNDDRNYIALRKAATANATNDYCTAVKNKTDMIETYKSQHSILKNSIKYFPSLIGTLHHSPYANATQALLAAVLLYNMEPTPTFEEEVRRQLAKLSSIRSNSSKNELIKAVNLHANTILKRVSERSALEDLILTNQLAQRQEILEEAYLDVYQVNQRKGLVYFYSLILTCFALGGWLIRLFGQVKQSGEDLRDMNLNLEAKVSQRTLELSDAMKKLADSQQLLMQSTKMTALGEMAGGIAHEINSPLGAILLNATILLDKAEQANIAETRKRLQAIIKIVDRVSKIILGLKRFARSSDISEKSEVSILSIVEDTLSLCSEKMKSHSIDLRLSEVDPQLRLNCVPEHISQVLLNFLNNSLDALRESVPEDKRWIQIAACAQNGSIEISLTDAGAGLSEAVQAKIMQPFFTTKAPGVGTGLGLSISKGIVEQHGGQLTYDKHSANTRFVITLPSGIAANAALAS